MTVSGHPATATHAGTLGLQTQIDNSNATQARVTRAQGLQTIDLSTPGGVAQQTKNLQEQKTQKSRVKEIYQREVAAIKKQIKGWKAQRDEYRRLARRTTGKAKQAALAHAASAQALMDQGAVDINAAQGSIADTELDIQDLNQQIAQVPADAAAATATARATTSATTSRPTRTSTSR